jgi:hypothetical protein
MAEYEHDWPSFQTTTPTTSDALPSYDDGVRELLAQLVGSRDEASRVSEEVLWAHAYGTKLILYTRHDLDRGDLLARLQALWTERHGQDATVESRWVGHCVYREVQAGGPGTPSPRAA